MAKKQTLESINAAMSRWQTRLRRAANMVAKLEGQRRRLEKAASKPKATPAPKEPVKPPAPERTPLPAATPVAIDTSIPEFLQRTPDPGTGQLKAELADQKARKTAGRIAKMKAVKSGETKRMPLTGRAALAAIRGDAGAEKR